MTSCCLIKVIVNTCLLSGNISVINFSFKDGDVSALTVSYARRGETLKCGSWALVLLFWHNWPFESPGGTSFSVPPGMILSRGREVVVVTHHAGAHYFDGEAAHLHKCWR